MPEPYSMEDEAVRYVLGELSAEERREFEAQLEHSVELRVMLRELEEGAVALAAASPPRRPPSAAWEGIEKAVEREQRGGSKIWGWWVGWVRSGWAAATVCAVGWVLYALWVKPPSPANNTSASGSQVSASRGAQSSQAKEHDAAAVTYAASNSEFAMLQASTQEMATLRWQITQLESRLTQVSRTVTQQQSLLAESNRLKFFQMSFGSGEGSDGSAAQTLSPRLQWALYTAMARELGWQSQAGKTAATAANGNSQDSKSTSQSGVDFVDLRPATNTVASSASAARDSTEVASASSGSISNGVAGFISGTSAYVAFDSLVVSTGSLLTFWMTGDTGQYQALGNTMYGNNPMVVTVPTTAGLGQGSLLTVTATTPSGAVTNIGHVFLPSAPAP